MEQLQVICNNSNNNVVDYTYPTLWSIGLLVIVSLVLWWRNKTTEDSSPYKVGLINVGTKFVQSRLVWSEIAYGRLNFRRTVIRVKRFIASANLAPHQSAQVIIQLGTRYVDFVFFVRRLDFRFGPFLFFPVFDSTCDLISDSASKNVKAWYRPCFDSKPPISLHTVRGTLGCFIRGDKVYGHMSHSSV